MLTYNIKFYREKNELYIIDQTLLPNEEKEILLDTIEEMYDAIKFLKVRGAPAIGICAACCVAVLAEKNASELLNSPGENSPYAQNAEASPCAQSVEISSCAQSAEVSPCAQSVEIPSCAQSAEVSPCAQSVEIPLCAQSVETSPGAQNIVNETSVLFLNRLKEQADYLNSSRPTAVNLSWALKRMLKKADDAVNAGCSLENICSLLADEAELIHAEDISMCTAISEYGLTLVKDGDGILTHCNVGPLATSKYGAALGPILLGKERGITFHVFADETRPLLQGARLTSYELDKAGVDVTLICDNMANTVMKKGLVNAVFVGSDRITANGDVANKIGTCGVAILANYYNIPFYVLAPSSSIDLSCPSGDDIVIEERDPEEIKTMFYEKPMAPSSVKCFNPAFDVTDHSLVTGIVTEKGVVRPPYDINLKKLFS